MEQESGEKSGGVNGIFFREPPELPEKPKLWGAGIPPEFQFREFIRIEQEFGAGFQLGYLRFQNRNAGGGVTKEITVVYYFEILGSRPLTTATDSCSEHKTGIM